MHDRPEVVVRGEPRGRAGLVDGLPGDLDVEAADG